MYIDLGVRPWLSLTCTIISPDPSPYFQSTWWSLQWPWTCFCALSYLPLLPPPWPCRFALGSTRPCTWHFTSPSLTPPGSSQYNSIAPTGNWASLFYPWPSIPDPSISPQRPYLRPIFSSWPRWWRRRSWYKIWPLPPPIICAPTAWGPSRTFP